MIQWEDAELEEFSLKEGDIAVPMDIYLPCGSAIPEITAYRAFSETAQEFLRLYGDAPLSDAAAEFLHAHLSQGMARFGFTPARDALTEIREYKMERAAQCRTAWILPETVLARRAQDLAGLENRTTHRLFDEDDAESLCAVHVIDGKIAAYAALNDTYFEDGAAEISVECAPEFRCRGYAASCAARLAAELLAEDTPVRYHCRTGNAASRRVAEKIGFTLLGVRRSYVCYRGAIC